MSEKISNLIEENKDLKKKLFKCSETKEIINLDPYEMHKKIRLYESTIEMM